MCGIAGIFDPTGGADLKAASEMVEAIKHRGPDGAGAWISREASTSFAHRRLAIIDLSGAGAQPMFSEKHRLAITFNGEIYNYQDLRRELESDWEFVSDTDTETILAGYQRWGEGVLDRLQGMFAFGIWDEERDALFLARDRCGEKPLYYTTAGKQFLFASEIKALWRNRNTSRNLDIQGALDYFQYGYLAAGRTMVRGVHQLPPAHAMIVTRNGVRKWRYWGLPAAQNGESVREEDLSRSLEHLLTEAVRRQLVADVPVGVLLSGGVDSSLITALAARNHGKRIRTFTITFSGSPAFDEARYAKAVARHCNTEHVELEGTVGGPEILYELARQFDEPLGDSSQIPTLLVSRLARQHCKVVLGGDGGDELFGGYKHYNRLITLNSSLLTGGGGVIVSRIARQLPFGVRGRNFLLGYTRNSLGHPVLPPRLFDAYSLNKLITPDFLADRSEDPLVCGSLLRSAQQRDFERYLPGDVLMKVDRASMLSSLEVRAPLLDHRVVEFAFGQLPDSLKADKTAGKILIKRLLKRMLPPDFDVDRKQGFSIPLGDWLAGQWGKVIYGILDGMECPMISTAFVKKLIAGQRAGRRNTEVLFAMTMFELWRREYRIVI